MMRELPAGLTKYSQSPLFTQDTVPEKLTTMHSVKQGVWGKLIVQEGWLNYIVAGTPHLAHKVMVGDCAVIEPEVEHWVEITGPVSFVIEFYRAT